MNETFDFKELSDKQFGLAVGLIERTMSELIARCALARPEAERVAYLEALKNHLSAGIANAVVQTDAGSLELSDEAAAVGFVRDLVSYSFSRVKP